MAISINNNTAAQNGLNAFNRASEALNTSIERVSTGRRINKAADDASGLIIADTLNSQARGAGQTIQNLTNDISRIQIVDSALGNATQIILGIRENALQAASGSQTTETRQALQSETAKALEGLSDLYQNTTYGGQNLLSDNPGLSALSNINLLNEEGAQAAIQASDEALKQIQETRSDFGSRQNQLASEINNLGETVLNLTSAQSQIRDVDLAEETMNMKRLELLRRASIFALAQSNTNAKNVQALIGG